MKQVRLLLILLFTAGGPFPLLGLETPPHPTLLVAEFRDQLVPVVGAEKSSAVALFEGRRKTLPARVALQTRRMPAFSAARASLVIGKLNNLQLVTAGSDIDAEKVVGTPGSTVGGIMEFDATITADRDLKDCYVVLISFESGFISGEVTKPDAQIRLRQIPDLAAGRATTVKFSAEPFLGDPRNRTVFVLLFSGSEEIYTGPNVMAWRYFECRERMLHRAALKTWVERFQGKDMPIAPAVQIAPYFPDPVKLPQAIDAELEIDATGDVSAVTLPADLAPAVRTILESTLRAWRFYPKLAGGVPVPARVRVPLKF